MRARLGLVLIALAGLVGPLVASAHPLSKDSWSLRTAIRVADEGVDVLLVLEVPFDEVREALQQAAQAQPDTPPPELVRAYGAKVLERLGGQATLQMNGAPVPGRFSPKDHPMNGRGSASGGFFLWMVAFEPQAGWSLTDPVSLTVSHADFTEESIVYSAMSVAGAGWRVAHDSARDVLPSGPYLIDDPSFWSPDPRLREVTVRFVRQGS